MQYKSKNNPGETAGFLAATVGGLDSCARTRGNNEVLYRNVVAHTVRGFLDAFRSARKNVVPVLPSYRRRGPIKYAGLSGTSYHEIVCLAAYEQYRTIFIRLEPERCFRVAEKPIPSLEVFSGEEISADDILADWDVIAADLAQLFADFELDSQFLQAGITTEERIVDTPNDDWQRNTPCLISIVGLTIRVGTVSLEVEPHFAKWISRLIDARADGEKVTAETLTAIAGHGKNVSREFAKYKRQFPALDELIASQDGKGGGFYITG